MMGQLGFSVRDIGTVITSFFLFLCLNVGFGVQIANSDDVPHIFQDGKVATASHINNNFAHVSDALLTHEHTDQGGNTSLGNDALGSITTGIWNLALGFGAATNMDSGSWNIAIGPFSMYSAKESHNNLGVGRYTLYNLNEGLYNVGLGSGVMYQASQADRNVGVGLGVMERMTAGNRNAAFGHVAMQALDLSGGEDPELQNVDLRENSAFGAIALQTLRVGEQNTAIGNGAMWGVSNASFNTAIGSNALRDFPSGNFNTALGVESSTANDGINNAMALGYRAKVRFSNTVQIGNSDVSDVFFGSHDDGSPVGANLITRGKLFSSGNYTFTAQNAVTNASDLELGLAFLQGLRPLRYLRAGESAEDLGFAINEVSQLLNQSELNLTLVGSSKDGRDGLDYDQLIPILVNAILELETKNQALTERLELLEQN